MQFYDYDYDEEPESWAGRRIRRVIFVLITILLILAFLAYLLLPVIEGLNQPPLPTPTPRNLPTV
jgi:hypothetical protein